MASESRSETPAIEAQPALVRRVARRLTRFVLLLVVPLVVGVVGLVFYAKGGRHVVTENAYVKAEIIAVSADLDGRVIWVGVDDNQEVSAGQVLFRLDPAPFEVAVAEADARLDVVRTEIESLRVDYREALVEAGEASERVRFLDRQFQRQKRIKEKGLGTGESYDTAEHELAMARRRVNVIGEQGRRKLAQLGGDADAPVEAHPRYRSARADREQALIDLGHTTVKAPADGVISNMKLQPGEYVEEGKPIFSLIEGTPAWVEANLKETQLTHVRSGQRATIVADAYPDYEWQAVVEAIAPATGAEFSLLPPQNATGNWVKVVQRVPVRLQVEHRPDAPPLRAGMTVTASIDTERRRDLPGPVRNVLQGDRVQRVVQGLIDRYELPGFVEGMLGQAMAAPARRP
jgi:membrane fusion protein (multidrug efflux system)